MRIKLDENLPDRLVPLLAQLGHDVDTVISEQLAGQEDDVVWRAAQSDSRFLITQDLDFSDARKYMPGTHHGLLLLQRFPPSTARKWLSGNQCPPWQPAAPRSACEQPRRRSRRGPRAS